MDDVEDLGPTNNNGICKRTILPALGDLSTTHKERNISGQNLLKDFTPLGASNLLPRSEPPVQQTISSFDRAVQVFNTIAMMPENPSELLKWHSDLLKQVNALVEQSSTY